MENSRTGDCHLLEKSAHATGCDHLTMRCCRGTCCPLL